MKDFPQLFDALYFLLEYADLWRAVFVLCVRAYVLRGNDGNVKYAVAIDCVAVLCLAICKIKPTTKKLPSATIHSKSTNKLIKAEAGESSIFGFYLSSVASYSQQRDTLGFVCLAIFSFFFGQTNYAARSLNRDTQAQLGEFSLSRPSLPFVRANMLTSIWLSSSSTMLPLKLKHDKTIPSNFLC